MSVVGRLHCLKTRKSPCVQYSTDFGWLVGWFGWDLFVCFFSSVFQSAVELIYGHRAYGRGSLTVYNVCLVPLS